MLKKRINVWSISCQIRAFSVLADGLVENIMDNIGNIVLVWLRFAGSFASRQAAVLMH